MVTKLLENRLLPYRKIDLYFSAMGNTVRQTTMQEAVSDARSKWQSGNDSEIRVFIQQSSEIPLLQAADYMLWAVQRAYERKDFRYYNYLRDKICMVHDVFDSRKYPDNCYSPENPLTKNRPCMRLGCFRNAWHGAHFHLNRTYLSITEGNLGSQFLQVMR